MSKKSEIRNKIANLKVKTEGYEFDKEKFLVYGLTSRELEEWRRYCRNPEIMNPNLAIAKKIQLALHDNDGNLLFTDKDLMMLGDRPADFIEPIDKIIDKLSGLGFEAYQAILKNFAKTFGADGSSGQPESINAPSQSSSEESAPTN